MGGSASAAAAGGRPRKGQEPPAEKLAPWWEEHGAKITTPVKITLGVASGATGLVLGHAFADLDIKLLGIGWHRNWFFHSALPAVGLAWLGDRMIVHWTLSTCSETASGRCRFRVGSWPLR